MTPAWHALRSEIIAQRGHDAWLDLLAQEHANALVERARLHTLMRADPDYTGTNARELQKLLAEKIA